MDQFRYSIAFFVIIACAFFKTCDVYAKADDFLKVGIESTRNSSAITLDNKNINVYFILENEFVDFGSFEGTALSVVKENNYYAATEHSFYDFDSANAQCAYFRRENVSAVPRLSDNGTWGVLIGGFANKSDAQNYINIGYAQSLVTPSVNTIALSDNGLKLAVFDNDKFKVHFSDDSTGSVSIKSGAYRGYITAYGASGGLMAVNTVSLEDYLFSVVPSEMPSGWHIEALKAQAVAARSYTYTRKGVHGDLGYDLCDGVHCQLYLGMSTETESSRTAVNETSGLLACHGGEVINATFFSSSGGMTENSENVWSNTVDYLRSVADIYEKEAKVWTRSFSLGELTELAGLNGLSVGQVTGAAVKEVSAAGRVLKMEITGASGSKVLEKEDIRTFFSKSDGGVLESRNFMIGDYTGYSQNSSVYESYVIDGALNKVKNAGSVYVKSPAQASPVLLLLPEGNVYVRSAANSPQILGGSAYTQEYGGKLTSSSGNTVVFSGRGWGHGVGLSQFGAKGMAEAGHSYIDILTHYYTGISLMQAADLHQ